MAPGEADLVTSWPGAGPDRPSVSMRLFVATFPPRRVVEVLDGLPRPERPGLSWAPSSQWHVTLRFFGDVDVDQGVGAGQAVARAAELAAAATGELGPVIGCFGRNILHVPVSGLEALAETLGRSTAEVGKPPRSGPFSGHITLARNRGRGSLGDLAGTPVLGSWKVDEISLVASLAAGRPGVPNRHEVVATFPLAG